MTTGDERQYAAYLLRLWQIDRGDGHPVRRAALEDARTGERRGFADLAWLCAFLEVVTATLSHGDPHLPSGEQC